MDEDTKEEVFDGFLHRSTDALLNPRSRLLTRWEAAKRIRKVLNNEDKISSQVRKKAEEGLLYAVRSDPDDGLREGIVGLISDKGTLEHLALHDLCWLVRYRAAKKVGSKKVLQQIKKDPHEWVQDAADLQFHRLTPKYKELEALRVAFMATQRRGPSRALMTTSLHWAHLQDFP